MVGVSDSAGLGLLLLAAADSSKVEVEKLAHTRNLGKAFYENPTTKKEAVAELRKALDLAPNSARDRSELWRSPCWARGRPKKASPRSRKSRSRIRPFRTPGSIWESSTSGWVTSKRATRQFEQMVKLVPDEPISHYNLGVLYKMAERTEDAIKKFELTAQSESQPGRSAFSAFQHLPAARRQGQSRRSSWSVFKDLKDQHKGAVIAEDMEWSFYSELYDVVDSKADSDEATAPASLKFSAPESCLTRSIRRQPEC